MFIIFSDEVLSIENTTKTVKFWSCYNFNKTQQIVNVAIFRKVEGSNSKRMLLSSTNADYASW